MKIRCITAMVCLVLAAVLVSCGENRASSPTASESVLQTTTTERPVLPAIGSGYAGSSVLLTMDGLAEVSQVVVVVDVVRQEPATYATDPMRPVTVVTLHVEDVLRNKGDRVQAGQDIQFQFLGGSTDKVVRPPLLKIPGPGFRMLLFLRWEEEFSMWRSFLTMGVSEGGLLTNISAYEDLTAEAFEGRPLVEVAAEVEGLDHIEPMPDPPPYSTPDSRPAEPDEHSDEG